MEDQKEVGKWGRKKTIPKSLASMRKPPFISDEARVW